MKMHTSELAVGSKAKSGNMNLSHVNTYIIAPMNTCNPPPINNR